MKKRLLSPLLANLAEEFRKHLVDRAGLSPATCPHYVQIVREFLIKNRKKLLRRRIDFERLSPSDLMAFVTWKAQSCQPVTLQKVTSTLRSFFKFLSLTGRCSVSLAGAVPKVAGSSRRSLPRHLTQAQLQQLLAVFSEKTPANMRNYAMVLCLAKLGLRAKELIQLRLDDIDWRSGVVLLPATKGRCPRRLPLSAEVGKALAEYVRRHRPTSSHREIFLSIGLAEPLSNPTLHLIIREALLRAELVCARPGPQMLRHTFATHLIQSGTHLKALADLMGHRRLDSTMCYAKVNLPMLTEIAQPWPEVVE